jgi:hypothetical protein
MSDHHVPKEADAVVNAADADQAGAIDTLLSSLVGSGKVLLHTSGSSLVGDRAAGEPSELIYSEDTPLKLEPEMRGRHNINQRVAGAAECTLRDIASRSVECLGLAVEVPVGQWKRQARSGVHDWRS